MSTLDPQLTTQLSQTSRTAITQSAPIKVASGTPPAAGQQMAGEVIPPPQGQSAAAAKTANTTWVQLSDGRVMALQTERPLPPGTQISVTGRQDQQVNLQVLPQKTTQAAANAALQALSTTSQTNQQAGPATSTAFQSPSTAILSALVRQLPEPQQQQLIQRLNEISQPQATQQTAAAINKASTTGDTQSLLQLASQQLRQALPVQQSLQQTLQQITNLLPQLKATSPDLMSLLQTITDKVPKGDQPPSAQEIKHWINSSGPLLEARMAQGKGDVQQDLKLLLQRAAAMLLQQSSAQGRTATTHMTNRSTSNTTGQSPSTAASSQPASTNTNNAATSPNATASSHAAARPSTASGTTTAPGANTAASSPSSSTPTLPSGSTAARSNLPNAQASQFQQAAQQLQSASPASLLATMTPPTSAGATSIRAALLQGALAGLNQALGSTPGLPAGTSSTPPLPTPGATTPNTAFTASSQANTAQSPTAQTQEALRQALGGALARIQVQQHTALQQTQTSFDRGQPAQVLQTDIPYMVRNEWQNAHLDIRRLHINEEGGGEGSASEAHDRPWQVRLRFELNDWGVVHTHLVLRGEKLKADVWVEEASAYKEMQSAVESLASRLRSIGAEVENVDCHIGTPPSLKAESTSSSGLIDTHI